MLHFLFNRDSRWLNSAPVMCFRRNTNLKEFHWMNATVNNKAPKVILSNREGYSIPCQSKTRNVWWKQINHTKTFSSTLTKRTYNIYNKLNYKSIYLNFLMEWWWWCWIVFMVWFTEEEKRLALFPVETIVRDPHQGTSLARSKQDLSLRRTWVQALFIEVVQ